MRYFTDYTDSNGNEHRLYTVRGIFMEIMDRSKTMGAGGEYDKNGSLQKPDKDRVKYCVFLKNYYCNLT